jgi:endonuclease/exonuclease/phosphatase family metal-dependent hydrolase
MKLLLYNRNNYKKMVFKMRVNSMKNYFLITAMGAFLVPFVSLNARLDLTKNIAIETSLVSNPTITAKSDDLRIATYNLRRIGKEQSPTNLWENRKSLVFDMIMRIKPDIIGFQEVSTPQLDNLKLVMADYESFGEPRSATMTSSWQKFAMKFATDDRNPIFYNKNKFTLLKQGNFGINPRGRMRIMPANLPRICTWGYFKDNRTGKTFYVYNTHLDNNSGLIRRRQIRKIMKHITANTQNEPVVFMGDLNTPLKGKYKGKMILKAGLVHAKVLAEKAVGPLYTRTGWTNGQLKAIDHIFVKPQLGKVKTYEVVESPAGIFPSDHRPVFVDIKIE